MSIPLKNAKLQTNLNADGFTLENLPEPSNDGDAATKGWTDAQIDGFSTDPASHPGFSADTWRLALDVTPADVRNFGAKGDGVTDDTAAIQAALDAGSVMFPFTGSAYIISDELKIPSNRIVRLLDGVALFRANDSVGAGKACFWRNADYVGGNSNITILGGFYDGNANMQTRTDDAPNGMPGGVGFRFNNVTNLTVSDIYIEDAITFAIQAGNIRQAVFENHRYRITHPGNNKDGLHLNGPATNVRINKIFGDTRDDFIALNADDGYGYQMTNGAITQVEIANCNLSLSPCFMRIISNGSRVDDITVRNIYGSTNREIVNITSYEDVGTANVGEVRFENIGVITIDNFGYKVGWEGPTNVESLTIDGFDFRTSEVDTFEFVKLYNVASVGSIKIRNGNITLPGVCQLLNTEAEDGADHAVIGELIIDSVTYDGGTLYGSVFDINAGTAIGHMTITNSTFNDALYFVDNDDATVSQITLINSSFSNSTIAFAAANGGVSNILSMGCSFVTHGTSVFNNAASTVSLMMVASKVSGAPHLYRFSGTIPATPQAIHSTQSSYSLSGVAVNKNATTAVYSVHSSDFTVTRSDLTPVAGDTVRDSNNVLWWHNGTAFAPLVIVDNNGMIGSSAIANFIQKLSLGNTTSSTTEKLLIYDDGTYVNGLSQATGQLRMFFDTGSGSSMAFGKKARGSTFTEYLRLLDGGNLGLGTTTPGRKMEINSATGDCLRLTYNDADGSAANYADLQMSSGGDLTITPSGGDFTVANALSTDQNATGGNTRFLLYDVTTATLQRVKVGANSSGPSGTGRALYIDNSP